MFENVLCIVTPLPVDMTRAPSNNDIAPAIFEIFFIVISVPILWVLCYYIGVCIGCDEFSEAEYQVEMEESEDEENFN
jgi:hypothetical protein